MNKKTLVSLLLVMSMLFSLVPCMSLSAAAADEATETATLYEYLTMDGKKWFATPFASTDVTGLKAKVSVSQLNTNSDGKATDSWFFGGRNANITDADPNKNVFYSFFRVNASGYAMAAFHVGAEATNGLSQIGSKKPTLGTAFEVNSYAAGSKQSLSIDGAAAQTAEKAIDYTRTAMSKMTFFAPAGNYWEAPDESLTWHGNAYWMKLYNDADKSGEVNADSDLIAFYIPVTKDMKDTAGNVTAKNAGGFLDLFNGNVYTNNNNNKVNGHFAPGGKTLGTVDYTYEKTTPRTLKALNFHAATQEEFDYQAGVTVDVPASVAITMNYDKTAGIDTSTAKRTNVTLKEEEHVFPEHTYSFIDYAVIPAGAYFKTPFTPELVSGLKAKASVSSAASSLTYDIWFFGNRYASGYYSFLRVPGGSASSAQLQPTQYIQPGSQLRGTAVNADDTPFEVDSYAVPGRHIFNANGKNNNNTNDVAYPAANEWHNLAFFVPGGGQAANFKYATTMGWRGTAYWMKLYRDGGKTSSALNAAGRTYHKEGNIEEDLIASYIPAVDENGKVGFYEMISGEFYVSEGTKQFTAGTDNTDAFVKTNKDGSKTFGVANTADLRAAIAVADAEKDTIQLVADVAVDPDNDTDITDVLGDYNVDKNGFSMATKIIELREYITEGISDYFDTGADIQTTTYAKAKLSLPNPEPNSGSAYNAGVLTSASLGGKYKSLITFYATVDRNTINVGYIPWSTSVTGVNVAGETAPVTVETVLQDGNQELTVTKADGTVAGTKSGSVAEVSGSEGAGSTYKLSWRTGTTNTYAGNVYYVQLGEGDSSDPSLIHDYFPASINGVDGFYDFMGENLCTASTGSFTASTKVVGKIIYNADSSVVYEVGNADVLDRVLYYGDYENSEIVLTDDLVAPGVDLTDWTVDYNGHKILIAIYDMVDYIKPAWNAYFDTGASVATTTDAVVKLTTPVNDDLDNGKDGTANLANVAYNVAVLENTKVGNGYKALLNFYANAGRTEKVVQVLGVDTETNAQGNASVDNTEIAEGTVLTVTSHIADDGMKVSLTNEDGVKFAEVANEIVVDNADITQTYKLSYTISNRYYSGNIYRVRLGDETGWIRDYVPVVVNGAASFYDGVNKTLNGATGGSFTAGKTKIGAIKVSSDESVVYEVANADALSFAMANAQAGDTIVLTANVTGAEEYTVPEDVTFTKGDYSVTVTVYPNVSDDAALASVLKSGVKSVALGDDVTVEGSVTVPAGCVLNLNGHVLEADVLTAVADGALVIDSSDVEGSLVGTLAVDENALPVGGTTYTFIPAPVENVYKFYSVVGDLFDENSEKTLMQAKEDGDQAAFVFALGKDFQSKIRTIFNDADEGTVALKLAGTIIADSDFTVNGTENSTDSIYNFDYNAAGAIKGATDEVQNVYVLFSGFENAPSVKRINNVGITLNIGGSLYELSGQASLNWARPVEE